MKAQELRIGNFIDRNGIMEVKAIEENKLRVYDHYNRVSLKYFLEIDSFKPIPLTEQWLLKFGFEYLDEHHLTFTDGYITFRFFPLVRGLELENDSHVIPLYKHQYVHQLQNLYYALTGEELTPSSDTLNTPLKQGEK